MKTIIALIAAIRCPASGNGHDFGTRVAQAYLARRAGPSDAALFKQTAPGTLMPAGSGENTALSTPVKRDQLSIQE